MDPVLRVLTVMQGNTKRTPASRRASPARRVEAAARPVQLRAASASPGSTAQRNRGRLLQLQLALRNVPAVLQVASKTAQVRHRADLVSQGSSKVVLAKIVV